MSPTAEHFERMLDRRDVVVCVGSGGVGKTTTSAVLGLQAALRGQRVLVMTIDPARRLANSLGVESLTNEATRLEIEQFRDLGLDPEGELWAMMLDMKKSFDRLVDKRSPDDETRDAILDNEIYQRFSTSLAGTQEYAAAERLYEIHQSGAYDLIVLDTPPTTHALDFLEAPKRLARAVESKAFQWLYERDVFKGQSGFGLFSVGSSYILKTLSRFTGRELLEEMSTFLQNFSPLLDGFKERAREVRALIDGEQSTFVIVTSPDPHTRSEATHFYEELGEERGVVGSFIVNRVHPHWVPRSELDRSSGELADDFDALEIDEPALDAAEREALAAKLRSNAADFYTLALKDRRSISELEDYFSRDLPVATVPFFSEDIHSLSGLNRVRNAIF